MKIYLCGAITNNQNYKQEFARAENYYGVHGKVECINPVNFCDETMSHDQCMKVCLQLVKMADILIIINDISNSKGAKEEVKYAIDNYIPIVRHAADEIWT